MNNETYFKLYDWIIQVPGISTAHKFAYAIIYQMGARGWYGGVQKLADRIGISKRTCLDIINHLENIGAIEKKKTGRKNTLFATKSWAEDRIKAFENKQKQQ